MMTNAATDASTEKPGLGDLAEIFYSPSAVFARRTDGKFGMPYLALVVLGTAIFLGTKGLIAPVIDAEIARGMARAAAKNPAMTPEAQATATSIARTVGSFAAIALFVIGPFIIGLFTWLAGKVAQVREIGTVALLVATFSIYPRLLGSIVAAVLAAMLPEGATLSAASISLSPARFIDTAASPGLAGLLGRFDLFVLWGVFLIATGVKVAGKASPKQAWGTAIGVWTIPTLLAIVGLLRNG